MFGLYLLLLSFRHITYDGHHAAAGFWRKHIHRGLHNYLRAIPQYVDVLALPASLFQCFYDLFLIFLIEKRIAMHGYQRFAYHILQVRVIDTFGGSVYVANT